MKKTVARKVRGIAACCLAAVVSLQAQQHLLLASAAGYKKPVGSLVAAFEKRSGLRTETIFGNLQMVVSQAKLSGEVAIVIGDRRFLDKLGTALTFSEYVVLGRGIPVLAFRKGMVIRSPGDLLTDTVRSVFIPQDGKAIYGIAGKEALASFGYTDLVAPKLTEVGTVPQVLSYLLTGEADAGFINLTEALANEKRLGGYIVIPDTAYTAIDIVAGRVAGFESSAPAGDFLQFLQSDTARAVCAGFGL